MIKSGYIDVRQDATTGRVMLVFGNRHDDTRLFRVFEREEFEAFHDHLNRTVKP